jgi:5'-3' exoribonuclease 1
MGIPQFFGWLSRKYDTELLSVDSDALDHFYFDFNCLIYHCYATLMREKYDQLKEKTLTQKQDALIEEVLKYTKKIVADVKKTKDFKLSICIDGVVPMAKMHQQRLRRYKSPILKEWENDIKKKYGVYQEELLDTNQITPGTPFMNKLGSALQEAIDKRSFGNYVVNLSDANEFGEGEHKVMNMIRESKYKGKNLCIYGLDADLIMLSLMVPDNNVCLLRENVQFGRNKYEGIEFLYVNIENLSQLIYQEMMSALSQNEKTMEKWRLIQDYVFLGFLLGNDFLHNVPSLSIINNGVDFAIKLYAQCFRKCKTYLLSRVNCKIRINNGFLRSMFESLSRSEESNLKFLAGRRRLPKPPNFDDSYSEERWMWDRVPYNDKFKDCYGVIDYKSQGWKRHYYKTFFDFDVNVPEDGKCLQDICRNYFEGILFTTRYYFDGNVSWYWYNPYPVCPFASDLYEYMQTLADVNGQTLPDGEPFQPVEQLMMVLPKSSSHFIPDAIAKEMTGRLAVYYPDTFEWIAEDRMMLYSIEPKLPELDIYRIRQVIAEV